MPFQYYLLVVFALIAFYTDATKQRIPNWLTLTGFVVGVAFHLIGNGWNGLLFSLLGAGVAFVVLVLLYVFKAIGAGDVKLFVAIGAITGMEFSLYSIMYSIVYGGLIGLVILLWKQQFFIRIRGLFGYLFRVAAFRDKEAVTSIAKQKNLQFPFMYAVLPGITTTWYYFLM
ncbi:A24 family peptidase [Paenibacillus sp. UMB4589-SE434]|uniref:A24 family peptidase n=1 Tax=Paenibacillus sp. UMB4589-SE434 TaxID=3046314 RepID=UPI002551609D|nr:A24 family peptidase [Paenibacillus sp. UMB4589-SE434]MDK8181846.1 A24 family peptidase [Paenibacillus sp. UMB4589-SE434]